jgi:hypothetical protein
VILETLRGGDLRLSGENGAFVYQRLRPGVFFTANRGRDTGEFGTAPLDLIEREFRLFQQPVEWYFDATQTQNANRAVVETWTRWLAEHGDVLAQMHVLTGSQPVHLMIAIARHFSDSSNRLALHRNREEWNKLLYKTSPDLMPPQFDEPAIAVFRDRTAQGDITLRTAGCCWNFRAIGTGVIYSRFSGNDYGDLTDAALDEMDRLLGASPQKLSWFLDLREGDNVAAKVSRIWTEWMSARRDRFMRMTALAPSPLFPLVLTIAKFRSGTENLFRIHRELEPFRTELTSLIPAEAADALLQGV